MKYFKKADSALDVEVNKLSTIGNQSLIVKNTGGNDNDMFIANNGSLKMTISPASWNSEETQLFNLNYFNLFKVDGGENLAPKFKQVEMNVIMGLQYVASIDGYSYGSTYFNNLSKIIQIIIKGEINSQDHILVWGPESYMQNIIDLGTVESLMSYIKIINESQFDMTGIYLYTHEFVSDYGLHSNNFCIFLSTDGTVDNIYNVEETFIGLVPENSEINNYNFIIDENSCKINIDYENYIINVTQLNEDIQMINYEDQHVFKININDTVINDTVYDLLMLGYFIEDTQEIFLYDELNILINDGLVTLAPINADEFYITIDEPFGNGAGFYCLFGANFDSEDANKINMINMIPVEYSIYSLSVPDNVFSLQNYDGNSKLQIEFEYLNNFYPDIIYPGDIVLSDFINVYECNDIFNYVQKFYFINKFIFPDRLNKLEINNTTKWPLSYENLPHAQIYNVNCECYWDSDFAGNLKTINNCICLFSDDFNGSIIKIGGGSIKIPNINNLSVIEESACYKNENIYHLTIPNNIKTIKMGAFDCPNADLIEFGVITPYCENLAFSDASILRIRTKNLRNYIESDQGGKIFNGAYAQIWDENGNQFYGNFPKDIKHIGSCVFNGFNFYDSHIKQLKLDASISYGKNCFANSNMNLEVYSNITTKSHTTNYPLFTGSRIRTLTLGEDVTSMPRILTSINTYSDSPQTTINKLNINNLQKCNNKAFINTKVNIVNVKNLDSWLTYDSSNNMYNSPTHRGSELYINDKPIDNNLIIPEYITNLRTGAFLGVTNISSVILPKSISTINGSVFRNCPNLTSVTIPDSVTSISTYVFYNCSNLSEITCYAMTAPTISTNTFQNVKTGGVLKVPTGATGYDAWLSTSNYYLGKYGWTIEYI